MIKNYFRRQPESLFSTACPTPATTRGTVATASSHHTLITDWNAARRADSCRLRAVQKTPGPTLAAPAASAAEGVEVANEITQDSQFSLTLPALSSGTVVVLTVTARNAAGESPAGNAVEMAVP